MCLCFECVWVLSISQIPQNKAQDTNLLFLERYEGLKDKETQDITAEEGCFIDLESRVYFTKRC